MLIIVNGRTNGAVLVHMKQSKQRGEAYAL